MKLIELKLSSLSYSTTSSIFSYTCDQNCINKAGDCKLCEYLNSIMPWVMPLDQQLNSKTFKF